jgi:Uma2 family endonuclease
MAVSERLYSVEEFDEFNARPENRERLLELFQGEISEKMPTQQHGDIALTLGSALRAFIVPRKLGRVGVEIHHRMPNDTRNSLLPDISFVAGQKPMVTEGNVPQMPDLAVEIRSPNDTLKSLRDKANYYLLNGTRLVWIIDPAKQLVITLTPDDEQILLENETLDGGDVLPGFTIPVAQIFADSLA